MTLPKNAKEVCFFIGVINYYRDKLARRSHLLHTLTLLKAPKVKFKCTDVEQKSFD